VSATESTTEFGRCRARLELAVANACDHDLDWPSAVVAGVHAAVEFAAADPAAALVLTAATNGRPSDGAPEFGALVDHFARLLSRAAPPPNPRLPDAPVVIARIARQVKLQIEVGRSERLMEIAPDLAFLALMPYVGYASARRWSQPVATA
jgi:hypothetical protein